MEKPASLKEIEERKQPRKKMEEEKVGRRRKEAICKCSRARESSGGDFSEIKKERKCNA